MTTETANLCIWLSVGIVIVTAALVGVGCRWRKALRELEEERRKNKHFVEQVRVLERKLAEAWRDYDKLSHSWPYSKNEEEAHND
jgi:hypothetical protein